MKKKDNSEGVQSRREFFKNAAKGILPILGVMLLTGEPLIGKNSDVAMGCQYTCSGGCKNSCSATCMHSSSR